MLINIKHIVTVKYNWINKFLGIKARKYFKHMQTLVYKVINSEEYSIFENVIKDEDTPVTDSVQWEKRKERLAAIILGHQSTKYLGKNSKPPRS